MKNNGVYGIVVVLLLVGMLTLAFKIHPVKAEPKTWTVDDDGPADFSKIQDAIDAASSGDTIYVYNGTYYEHILVYKPVISLIGENKEATIIDGTGWYASIIDVPADNFSISSFTIRNGGRYGILVEGDCNIIIDNIITNNSWGGICVHQSGNSIIESNEVSNNTGVYGGIYLDLAQNNRLVGNVVSDNKLDGVSLYYSISNNLTDNTVANNTGTGIFLQSATNNRLRNNRMTDNRYNFGVKDSFLLDVDTSNLVDGKPIVYLVSEADRTVQLDAGYLAAVYCNNLTVQNLNLGNNRQGIMFFHTTNSTIRDNTVRDNWFGICSIASNGNNISHNNFIDNAYHVDSYDSVNVWDDGYPNGGNYWSGYAGVDWYGGLYQNETGSDGIGDSPYAIDADNRDNYPFTKPYPWDPHDVGVTRVAPSKTGIREGFCLDINVTIFNYGLFAETIDLSVYVNTTTIETKTISLGGGTFTTITFTWNTTGFSVGKYAISAYAWPVTEETYTIDNELVDGWILVTIPADVNCDGTVGILDAGKISAHWYPGPPIGPLGYDPAADLNDDGSVNILDAAIVSAHWGETLAL